MPYAERHVVPVTTAADGSATAYSPVLTGPVSAIHYIKTDFADGVDFTITSEATGQGLWTETNVNAAKVVAPRQPTHDQAGVASLYAAGGEPVEDKICLANDRVKIVIASGGNAKSGAFHIVIG
ncbi:MAG: hypothetical protein CVU44_11315 [Chloroflexi bacterium HGW-Chloroflexi-6]|nr:MAG: hypothetical protein CVU44_11315 [Chloroflexi bacterium HGW-Chloroflexi-6]